MSKARLENIIVYTDGSCSMNGKIGAIGGIGIHFPDRELKDVSKIYVGHCTNQRTELYAILQALKYINVKLRLSKYCVFIKTDSMYCINCITKWTKGWINNGWITKDGKPVANKELIENIYKYYSRYKIILEHVSAHTNGDDVDSIGNEIADALATRATKKAYINIKATDVKLIDKNKTIPYRRSSKEIKKEIVVELIPSITTPKKRQGK